MHGQGCSGSESPVGRACELHGASTAMVGVLKELLVLLVALTMVVGAKQRRWCFNEVWCGNAGLPVGFFFGYGEHGVTLIMVESVGVSTSPLPRCRRRGGLAMVVLSAMVSVPVHVRSYSDVQCHGWGPPFG